MDTPFLPSQHYPGISGLGLNCPGDPGCPGYVVPGSVDYTASLQDELTSLYDQFTGTTNVSNTLAPTTNTNWVLIGGLALVGFLLLRR